MTRELTYAEAIREGIDQSMQDREVFIIGEGVPHHPYTFGTTKGLIEKYGENRVLDMPVSENAVAGICIGAAIKGMRPIIVHQRLDFMLLSLDQLINNAAKWHYMFGGQMKVPLVVRAIIGRGWGQGAQHSQNLQAMLAHIPGLKVVMPSTAYDAKGLLIASVKDNNPVIFIEHRWLHNIKGYVPCEAYSVEIGKAKILQEGSDITIVGTSYMLVEAIKASKALSDLSCEIIDLITLKPLDIETVEKSVEKTGRLLVVDSGYKSGGIAADIIAKIAESKFGKLKSAPQSVTLPDLPTPSTPGLTKYYYPMHTEIIKKIGEILSIGEEKITEIYNREIRKLPDKLDVPDPSFTGPF